MPKLDAEAVVAKMLEAAGGVLRSKWPAAKDYAETEFRNFANSLLMIQKMKRKKGITPERAKMHVEIQKHAMRTVLLTLEGLGILAVEEAINAALGVVRDAVNKSIGWAIL